MSSVRAAVVEELDGGGVVREARVLAVGVGIGGGVVELAMVAPPIVAVLV